MAKESIERGQSFDKPAWSGKWQWLTGQWETGNAEEELKDVAEAVIENSRLVSARSGPDILNFFVSAVYLFIYMAVVWHAGS